MIESLRPVAAVGVCLLAAGLILLFGNRLHRNLREGITIAAAVCAAGLVFSMTPAVLDGQLYEARLWQIAEGVELAFRTDAAGMVFACIASFLWVLTSFYSIGYMRGHHEQNQTGYFAAFAVCVGSALGIALAANLMTFFIFYEMLTIATYPLVAHYRNDAAKQSGRKYLTYTLVSGQLFFAGIVILYSFTGRMDFVPGGFVNTGDIPMPWMLAVFILMIGAGIVKAGVMPLHSWLPAAMVAPTPVSALLHAVAVVKAGAFCTLRVVLYVFGPEAARFCHGSEILAWMAVATILISSLIAIRKDNLKARLAFSTVGQLSYIILGIAILSPFAATGALYHIVAHAFMKITLFMCAGAIFVTTHRKNISEMIGIGRQMPVTMTCFTLASLAVAGFPFFVGFTSKANIIMGAISMGQPFFVATLIVSALLALTYLMPVVLLAFKRDFYNSQFPVKKEANLPMLIPIMITAACSLILGVMPNFGLHLYDLAAMAGNAIFGLSL